MEHDPLFIPHCFIKKEDIEISGFFAATLAWGQRKTIIRNSLKLMKWMDNAPHEFILNYKKNDLKPFMQFTHRTFNGTDCCFFINQLSRIYRKYGSLEFAFSNDGLKKEYLIDVAIINFRKLFFSELPPNRSFKHVSNPSSNSSSKRLCMYLRWMVRKDSCGCDFGIWNSIHPSQLCLPLDVHTGRVARELGLLQRKQDDWKSVIEVTNALKEFDSYDPVKYDYALFGIGVNGEI
ncbi:MAG: TIGR02757 family protein [Bacteroidota bacterium]